MPIKLKSPLKKEFHLEKSDKELETDDGATMVTIRQATQGGFEFRNTLMDELRREYNGTTITVVQRISFDDIRRREVFLTLCGSNILDKNGKPLFEFVSEQLISEDKFLKAWGSLPPVIAQEIHEKVLEMNPLWDESPKTTTITSDAGEEVEVTAKAGE